MPEIGHTVAHRCCHLAGSSSLCVVTGYGVDESARKGNHALEEALVIWISTRFSGMRTFSNSGQRRLLRPQGARSDDQRPTFEQIIERIREFAPRL